MHYNIIGHTGGQPLYGLLADKIPRTGFVEAFLIMSGYFLYISHKRHPERSFVTFLIDKVARLWPVFALYTILSVFLLGQPVESALADMLFLRCTGLTLKCNGIVWYIGPFFYGTLIVAGILKAIEKRKAVLLLCIMALLAYSMNVNVTNGLMGRQTVMGFLSLGLLRCIAGISLGCIIAVFRESYSNVYETSKTGSVSKTVFVSIVELSSLGILIASISGVRFSTSITSIIVFTILFFCLLDGSGVLSRLLNNKISGILGRYAYSIYVMQQVSFELMGRTFWKNTDFLFSHAYMALALSTLTSVLVGVAVYHLVEAPATDFYRKFGPRLKKADKSLPLEKV